MEQKTILSMKVNDRFDGFFIVRSADKRMSERNGKEYLDMTLADASGDINAKMWDTITYVPEVGDIVKVRASITDFKGRLQMRVERLRKSEDTDYINMSLLVAVAPEPADNMLNEILGRAKTIQNAQLREITCKRIEACGEKLLVYPAAVKLHHAERAGLLHHTVTMLRAADAICGIYKNLDSDLLAAGVILHDLCKIQEIDADELGMATEYTVKGQLLGHIVQGVAELDALGKELHTDPELLILLEHMVLSHHDLPEYGSPKPPMFPEAEVLHTLDQLDARLFEMNRALENVAPGTLTEKIWSMDRRLYRRSDNFENA